MRKHLATIGWKNSNLTGRTELREEWPTSVTGGFFFIPLKGYKKVKY